MGLFDGILGGLVGGGMAAAVGHLIDEQGGVSAIVAKLEQGGLAETVKSWVSTRCQRAGVRRSAAPGAGT